MIGLDAQALSRASRVARITVREVTTLAGFEALGNEWHRLVQLLDVPSPFLDWEWNRNWWDAFGAGCRLRILVFEAAGEVRGIAQLHERPHRRGLLGVSSLAPLGWEDGGNQPVTEHLQLLFPSSQREMLFAAFARWLRWHPWAVTWLPSVREGDRLPTWIASHVVARCPAVPFHHRALPATWDEFVSGLNKSMRDNVKYYPRLMVRHGHDFTFHVAENPQDLAAAYPLLLDLHERRSMVSATVPHWNYLGNPGRRDFTGRMIRVLAGKGEAKIGVLRVRGEPVSAYLWFEREDTMFFYRSGYEPAWGKYSVALVVALEALKDGMRRGIRRVEFLRGGGQLKERWDTDVRLERHLMLARVPWLARRLVAARAARRRTTYAAL